jgi:hypothetical protein
VTGPWHRRLRGEPGDGEAASSAVSRSATELVLAVADRRRVGSLGGVVVLATLDRLAASAREIGE